MNKSRFYFKIFRTGICVYGIQLDPEVYENLKETVNKIANVKKYYLDKGHIRWVKANEEAFFKHAMQYGFEKDDLYLSFKWDKNTFCVIGWQNKRSKWKVSREKRS